MQVAGCICEGNLKLWHRNWTCTNRCATYEHMKNLKKTWKSWLFTLLQFFSAGFLFTPSVIRLPCHGRFLSRAKGPISLVNPSFPTDSITSLKQTATCLCSMWYGRTWGILETACSLWPPWWRSQAPWLMPTHYWMGWQFGLTVLQRMCLGLQVLNKKFYRLQCKSNEFFFERLSNPINVFLKKAYFSLILSWHHCFYDSLHVYSNRRACRK